MVNDLSKFYSDALFIGFIKAFKIFYWTTDLSDLMNLKESCTENLKNNLKLNIITKNILELYFNSLKEAKIYKQKNPKKYLSFVESLVFLSQKHDKMINDFGKDSIEASQVLNEYLDYRLNLRIDLEKEFPSLGDNDIEKKINEYQNSIWNFFNKIKLIYLEHETEVLMTWKDHDQQSIFIKYENPTKEFIN